MDPKDHRRPKERYLYALSSADMSEQFFPETFDQNGLPDTREYTIRVLDEPEEVALWLQTMGLVIDGDEVTSVLKKWEWDLDQHGGSFAGFGHLPENMVTDLGKEMVRHEGSPNRYEKEWDEWKKFRVTVKEVNADTVVGTREYEKLGS